MEKSSKIFVSGHRGMVGSAVMRALEARGYENVLTRSREDLDLTEAHMVRDFFDEHRPDVVVVGAAKVGGIHANSTYPAEFIYDNLAIAAATKSLITTRRPRCRCFASSLLENDQWLLVSLTESSASFTGPATAKHAASIDRLAAERYCSTASRGVS